MSRLTKYLKQQCTLELVKRDTSGNVLMNRYGEPDYNTSVKVRCRKERISKDILTTNGSVSKSVSRYYLDNDVEVRVGDKLDGRVVTKVSDFVNEFGVSEGYECYV